MGGAFDSSAEALRLQDTVRTWVLYHCRAVGEDEITFHFS